MPPQKAHGHGPSLTVTLTLTDRLWHSDSHRLTDTVDVHIMWPHALAGGG